MHIIHVYEIGHCCFVALNIFEKGVVGAKIPILTLTQTSQLGGGGANTFLSPETAAPANIYSAFVKQLIKFHY